MPPSRGETGIKFAPGTKDHRRTPSGTSIPTTSPRPGVKRIASSTTVQRNQNPSALRKNHSHGALSRHAGSSKNIAKMASKAKRRSADLEGTRTHKRKSSGSKDESHHTVRFDVGEEEGNDDSDWVEESGSQSPATTRTNTRQNSVILEASTETTNRPEETSELPRPTSGVTSPKPSSSHSNLAATSQQPSTSASAMRRTASADLITSRLLARSKAPPETSHTTASTKAETMTRSLSHQSQSSTLNEGGTSADESQGSSATKAGPGPSFNSMTVGSSAVGSGSRGETVSRFLDNAPGSAATSLAISKFPTETQQETREDDSSQDNMPHHRSNTFQPSTSAPDQRRPQSSSSASSDSSSSISPTQPRPSTKSRLTKSASAIHPPADPLNHPNRTQQKLWLQRASSNIDPPDVVGPPFTRAGISGLGGLVSGGGYMVPPSQRRSAGSTAHASPANASSGNRHGHSNNWTVGVLLLPVPDGVMGGATDHATRRAQREVTSLFHEVDTEFRGVRRFRDPAGEGIARVLRARKKAAKRSSIEQRAQTPASQPPRTPQSRHSPGQGQRRGVRFDTGDAGQRATGITAGDEDAESPGFKLSETERLCRLLWDRLEVTGQEG